MIGPVNIYCAAIWLGLAGFTIVALRAWWRS
jgi:hypothetical protein